MSATLGHKPTLNLEVNVMYLSIPQPEATKHSQDCPHLPGFLKILSNAVCGSLMASDPPQ